MVLKCILTEYIHDTYKIQELKVLAKTEHVEKMDENGFPRHQYLLGKKSLDQITVLSAAEQNKIPKKRERRTLSYQINAASGEAANGKK
ncbi:hypothetical protein NPIL_568561 [Nephila pilipes]|uniref:Uncharacterized protein n=1 Tax=Nephila pilipes TaxID=299642 RepID=A0A8X6MQM5_NEPPI|nr:hypothetical protein NPIL_568561 [Nephila pilipes]